MMEGSGSGSVLVTNGSGRPKNIRTDPMDPNPQLTCTFLLNALVEEPALRQGDRVEGVGPEGGRRHSRPHPQGEHLQLADVQVAAVQRFRVQGHHDHPAVR
jgi:hypothetical protein